MASELSGILEHVDRISELDLDGVEPTSHVVELENVLRADEPRPSLERDARSQTPLTPPTAPSGSRRPGARERRRDPRASRPPRALERIEAGELAAAEYASALRRRSTTT